MALLQIELYRGIVKKKKERSLILSSLRNGEICLRVDYSCSLACSESNEMMVLHRVEIMIHGLLITAVAMCSSESIWITIVALFSIFNFVEQQSYFDLMFYILLTCLQVMVGLSILWSQNCL